MNENLPESIYDDNHRIRHKETAHELANIEDDGHKPPPDGFIEKIVRKVTDQFPAEKRKVAEAQGEALELKKKKQEQLEMGNRIFTALQTAAESNRVFNLLDGRAVEGVGPIMVWPMEDNNGAYSINVEIKSQKSTLGSYPLFQIMVRMDREGKEIHVFKGPYGPDNDYAKQAADLLIERLSKEISEYRLYGEDKKASQE